MDTFHPTSPQAPQIPASVSRVQVAKHKMGTDPFHDWVLILTFSLILIVASIATGIYMYIGVERSLDNATKAQQQSILSPIADPKLFTSVIRGFDDRLKKHAGALREYSGPRDPSL